MGEHSLRDSPKMDISHELFSCFAFYSGLVLAKTLIMSFWTAKRRFAVGVFANPEDIKGTPNKVDLENVLPFVLLGGLYITTNPLLSTAKLVFRTFVGARFLHTFVYVFAVPQPSRALAFFANQICNMYMVYCILSKNLGHM